MPTYKRNNKMNAAMSLNEPLAYNSQTYTLGDQPNLVKARYGATVSFPSIKMEPCVKGDWELYYLLGQDYETRNSLDSVNRVRSDCRRTILCSVPGAMPLAYSATGRLGESATTPLNQAVTSMY
jgi:hypothetical protein